jgi:hypothetical protein
MIKGVSWMKKAWKFREDMEGRIIEMGGEGAKNLLGVRRGCYCSKPLK